MRFLILFVSTLCWVMPAHAQTLLPDGDVDQLWQEFTVLERQADRTAGVDADDYRELLRAAARIMAAAEHGEATLSARDFDRLQTLLNTRLDVATAALPAGGSATFEGVVLEQGTGAPVTEGTVRAIPWDDPFSAVLASIQPDGTYSMDVTEGHYVLQTDNTPQHIQHAWPDLPCFNALYCSPWFGGELIEAIDGEESTHNFIVDRGVRVEGTVTDGDDNPVADAWVRVRLRSGAGVSAQTDAAGEYITDQALPPGEYRVFVEPPEGSGLLAVLHGGQTCQNDCAELPVTHLTLSDVTTPETVDLQVEAGFGLSGVVDDGSAPLADAAVQLTSTDGFTRITVSTDSAGEYTFPPLRPADYSITVAHAETLNQIYPGIDCFSLDCAPEAGTPVSLGNDEQNLDFSLNEGATVSGQLVRASDGTPVENAWVTVFNETQGAVTAQSEVNGEFTVRGLVEGTFYVRAGTQLADPELQDTYLGDVTCPGGITCGEFGQPISVPASGSVTDIDITLIEGGALSGQIFDGQSGLPAGTFTISRLELWVASGPFKGALAGQAISQLDGTYLINGLKPGAYKATFGTGTHLGLIDTAFGGQPCPRGSCDLDDLPTVFVTAGTELGGIDATLPRGPVISGRVVDSDTGEPPAPQRPTDPNRLMAFYGTTGNYASFSEVDGDGVYRSRTGFPDDTFFVSTFSSRNMVPFGSNYIDQAYDAVDFPRLKCNLTTLGSGLNVAGSDFDNIDFSLRQGGGISGTVTDDDGGDPLGGIGIEVYDGAGQMVAQTSTNVIGDFQVEALPDGNYTVRTRNRQGYRNQIHDGGSCTPFCDPLDGTPISVSEGSVTSGIDFVLVQSATISGTVRVNGTATGSIKVEAYDALGNLVGESMSTGDGSFALTSLAAGEFYLRTRNAFGHADTLYADRPCVGDACRVRQGDPIVLDPGESVSDIDLDIAAGATISGEVHDRLDPSNTLSGVRVQLLDDRAVTAFEVTTGSGGSFDFGGLAAGDYHLVTRETPAYVDQTLGGTPCPSACNGLNGDVITVAAGGSSTGNNMDLAPGASISGNVLASGTPAVGAQAQVYNEDGVPVAQRPSNASGNYEIDDLPDGDFFVRVRNVPGHVSELWDGIACSGFCDILNGDAVTISGGAPVGSINFDLTVGGGISGTVNSGGSTATGVEVVAFDNAGFVAGSAVTNSSGQYAISGLVAGNYRLRTANVSGLVDRVYQGDACSPTPCALNSGSQVEVSGATVGGIDFSLDAGSSISGSATDTFGNPLPDGTAVLLDDTGAELQDTPVADGLWLFDGLADGTYYLLIENNLGLIDELYDGVPCSGGACDIPGLGTPIVLDGGALTVHARGVSGINVELDRGSTISGQVVDAATGAPLASVEVFFRDAGGKVVGSAVTDGLGEYESRSGLPAGDYFAATASGNRRGVGNNYINALYDGGFCLLDCDVTAGTVISVEENGASGIDFALEKGAGLRGRVSGPDDEDLVQTVVRVYDQDGFLAGTAATDSLGRYTIDGLPAGEYFAHTANIVGLTDVTFGDQPCGGTCDPLSGDPITVPASGFADDIDFRLEPEDDIFVDRFQQLSPRSGGG